MDLTKAMKSLQEAKTNESNKLAEIIRKQNLKKEGKELKEDYEGNYDPSMLFDDVEDLQGLVNILNKLYDAIQAGETEFLNDYREQIAEACDTFEEILKKAKALLDKEHTEFLADQDDLDDLEDDE